MTKEQFAEQQDSLEAQISALKEKLYTLEAEYIKANQPYEIGQKVKLVDRTLETIAEVVGYKLTYPNIFVPLFKKVKKDGSVSQNRAYVCNDTKIELL